MFYEFNLNTKKSRSWKIEAEGLSGMGGAKETRSQWNEGQERAAGSQWRTKDPAWWLVIASGNLQGFLFFKEKISFVMSHSVSYRQTPRLKQSSCLDLLSSQDYRHVHPSRLQSFCLFFLNLRGIFSNYGSMAFIFDKTDRMVYRRHSILLAF